MRPHFDFLVSYSNTQTPKCDQEGPRDILCCNSVASMWYPLYVSSNEGGARSEVIGRTKLSPEFTHDEQVALQYIQCNARCREKRCSGYRVILPAASAYSSDNRVDGSRNTIIEPQFDSTLGSKRCDRDPKSDMHGQRKGSTSHLRQKGPCWNLQMA